MTDKILEPMMIDIMRRHPTGHVQNLPNFPEERAKSGTTTAGFLREFDEYIAQIKEESWIEGMRQATDIAEGVILRNFRRSKSATISKD